MNTLPVWKIDSLIPTDYKTKSLDEKFVFLTQKFKTTNPLYLLVNEDLEKIVNSDFKNLQILDLDPRYLESKGFREEQIESFYKFAELVKNLINH